MSIVLVIFQMTQCVQVTPCQVMLSIGQFCPQRMFHPLAFIICLNILFQVFLAIYHDSNNLVKSSMVADLYVDSILPNFEAFNIASAKDLGFSISAK